jgi:Rap1a immunity proteins
MTRFAIVLLALLIASPARADNEMTAGDLYSLCTSADENDLTAYRFYVFGVVQGVILGSTMTANRKFVEKNNTVICLPGAVSIVRDTLKMTFAVYPRDRDLAAAGVVTAVFLQKFPCK